MGVHGLWPILHPCARPTPLPTLNRKRLAVDASIWIYQFLKAVRDKEGNALRNSHVVGFFRRICKLLYFGIQPVFVFDGGAPILKRQTITSRKQRREGRREDAVRTAGKLLAVQMQRRGEEEAERRKKDQEREAAGLSTTREGEDADVITAGQDLVYVGEMGMSAQERQQTRKFHKKDAYHLPELSNGIEGMGQPNDPRIMSAEELEDYARQFTNGEDVNLYDFSKIDFNGDFFMSLPPGDRYNILNAARLRSRLRMGLSKEQLEEMFPDRMEFSRFQIERVRERNELTQRLMNLNGMNGDELFGVGTGRIAGERGREYVLVKNDGVEGGWALGVVSTEKDLGERSKPIDVDALHQQVKESEGEEEEEDDFEDVPVEGLNRLPKVRANQEFESRGHGFRSNEQRSQLNIANNGESSTNNAASETIDSLFVDEAENGDPSNGSEMLIDEEDDDLDRAIRLSLRNDFDRPEDFSGIDFTGHETDEEEHLNRAIALSLQKNHDHDSESEDDGEFEDVVMPEYKQRAVEAPRPITTNSGKMVAHIVNNRANAAVPKKRAQSVSSDSDSDSDLDLQAALAKARKQKAPRNRRQPAPVANNVKNPFDGPLPFEKLDFKTSLFGKKQKETRLATAENEDEPSDDNIAGGFGAEEEEAAPKPLPPWLAASGDIRSDFEQQQKSDLQLDAEDREQALEDERIYRKQHDPIQLDSSDNESDVEIIDPPALRESTSMAELAENVKADPPISNVPQNPQPGVDDISAEKQTGVVDEDTDWSVSDYGGVVTKSADLDISRSAATDADQKSKSASPEFEDVDILTADRPVADDILDERLRRSESPLFPDETGKSGAIPGQNQDLNSSTGEMINIEPDEFDDFSDPDDEELLAQLAIEAEEHARFASTLNNKSERENQDSYEQELKALRSQQKKDRRDADEVSHIMITECQALLRLFGIPYITAPMEAEAQCAELVNLGLVDGVVTDDCDIFLFGGTRVYKNMFNSNKFVECYLASDIEKELSLSRHQLISIAHLLGSDYTEGLVGIGPVTALEILSEFPTPFTGLEEFKEWWTSAQTSNIKPAAESSTFRKKLRRSQGTKLFLAPGFPSRAVTEAYLKPDVDNTPEPFQWGVPDLDRLREFLMATIGWSQERTDEVLVPVIRDMNRREQEGTQSNITRFFSGAVGAGVNTATGKDGAGSKRMKDAVTKLKAKKKATSGIELGMTWADQAAEWAKKNDVGWTEREQAKAAKKRRKKKPVAAVDDVAADLDADEDLEEGNEAEAEEDDDSGEDFRAGALQGKGKAKGKGIAPRKRQRTEA